MKSPKFLEKLKNPKNPLVVRRIQGHSMVPVLPPSTMVWASRWFRDLKEGDVIIFRHEGREKIKRISEIKAGEVFVLGDHPETSTDSRQFGWIKQENIVAKLLWPLTSKD